MKAFFIIILISLIGCREEEGIWDELTPQEQAALRARAFNTCVKSTKSAADNYKAFIDNGYRSGDFARGRIFEYTLKEGTTEKLTVKLQVWKQDLAGEALYFYVEEGTVRYFLKTTIAQDRQIVSDLQTDHCQLKDTYIGSFGGDSISVTNKFSLPETDGGSKVYNDAYDFKSSEPMALGRFRLTRAIQKKKSDGTADGNEVKQTSNFSDKDGEWGAGIDSWQETGATLFCELRTNATINSVPIYRLQRGSGAGTYGTGFLHSFADPTHCQADTPPGTWNLDL